MRSTRARWFVVGLVSVAALASGCVADGPDLDGVDDPGKGDSLDFEAAGLDYFSESYDEARARFRATAADVAATFAGAETGALPVPSATDGDLTVDYLYIPARDNPDKLIILTSGVHGAEAFAGSAVQEMMLAEWLPGADLRDAGVLFVHSLNPWGYRHRRRVTENNVDLNRNLDIDPAIFETVNEGYRDLDGFLNRANPVDWADVNTTIFSLMWNALIHGEDALRQATLVGQYEFERGIYYGGDAFEPNKESLEALLLPILEPYRAVFLGDLHTGYGERGRLHLFGAPDLGDPEATAAVFAGFDIDTGDNNEDFYETQGDLIVYLGKLLAPETVYVGTTLEYGTLDSQTTIGSIRSLQRMRLENQGHHHGFASRSVADGVRERFDEMFYPTDLEWRAAVMERSRAMIPLFADRFLDL